MVQRWARRRELGKDLGEKNISPPIFYARADLSTDPKSVSSHPPPPGWRSPAAR
jgi:hypothetical protein